MNDEETAGWISRTQSNRTVPTLRAEGHPGYRILPLFPGHRRNPDALASPSDCETMPEPFAQTLAVRIATLLERLNVRQAESESGLAHIGQQLAEFRAAQAKGRLAGTEWHIGTRSVDHRATPLYEKALDHIPDARERRMVLRAPPTDTPQRQEQR